MLKKIVKRICLICVFLYVFLINSQYTDADIFAERIIKDNSFSAISLDFKTKSSFNNYNIDNLFYVAGALPYGFDVEALKIENVSSRNFNYNIKTVKKGGDDFLCSNLYLEILSKNFKSQYKGPLIEFSLNSEMLQESPENYIFFIGLDEDDTDLKDKTCNFDFYIKSYRKTPSEVGGVFAERKINNIISTSTW